ncbi:MAG: hypothetical protein M5U17_07640 [Ignavibacterium sp.]|jgi:Tol biopolymer transport system component|nr:PD40 domain-containing protein [Ignavibacterium album]MCZ7610026.1 hypothetical protein [Ignavibacterium sp.]MDX9711501.1 hypothetical protein [Ignavibacteriaceae bacterium]GIK22591.1 MAG: hypothetical protein BroJett005_20050 [Ignavibacteriota bacterium]
MSTLKFFFAGKYYSFYRISLGIISIAVLFLFFISCDINNDNDKKPPPIGDPPVYPLIDGFPSWSPDGLRIIYNHNGITSVDVNGAYLINPDSSGLWMINIDGSNPHLILKGGDINAEWSSDGNWIVMEKNGNIYKIPFLNDSLDETKIVQLTFEGNNFYPSWSSDGMWIAYDSNVDSPNGMNFIWKMKSDGTQKTRIAYSPTKGEIRMPSWSKNLDMIVHTRYSYEFLSTELFAMNENGNNLIRITYNGSTDYYPKVANDGSKIVFESNANVLLIEIDGSSQKQLTFNGGLQPTWAPDGQKIAYIGFTADNKYNPLNDGTIWIMNVDGSNKHILTFGPSQ